MSRNRHKRIEQPPADYSAIAEKMKGRIPEEVTHSHFNGNNETKLRRTLTIRTTPISIGIPMDELMFSKFFSNVICLEIMPWDGFITTASTLVHQARNTIHDMFLDESTHPYLLMLDSDVIPPSDLITRLLIDNKPVVGGWYKKKEEFEVVTKEGEHRMIQRPTVYDYGHYDEVKKHHFYNQRMKPSQGLEKVDGMGAGCWLVKREVAEAIGHSPFNLNESGEDLCFCRAVYKAGYEVWVDWNVECGHAGVFIV